MASRVRRYNPQLATLTDTAPSGAEWLHELKYDGYRIGALVTGGGVRLESRREIDWTSRFPEVVEAVRELGCKSAVIDGEVAVTEPSGRTNFQKLQNIFEKGGTRQGLTYYVFDLLERDGLNLTSLPLEERKVQLEKLLGGRSGLIKYSRHFEGDGPRILEHACRLGCEGIVSKRRSEKHRPGRSESWLKTKCTQRREFFVGGYTEPQGSRVGIGSILLGLWNDHGELVYAGGVGTGKGFTAEYLAEMRRVLALIEQTECPYAVPPPADVSRTAHWVRPLLVCDVSFVELTEEGHVRHPSLVRIVVRPGSGATE